jgi:hypothetical protein
MRWELRRAINKLRTEGLGPTLRSAAGYLNTRLTARSPYHRLTNLYWSLANGDTTRVVDEDWDYLIILDACRYDLFREQNDLDGDLQSRRSVASNTTTFLQRNFLYETLHDTVYVTANPKVESLVNNSLGDDPIFHSVVSLSDEWDEQYPTIAPEKVTETALETKERFEDKRLIIHYMQPHAPFIGPKADALHERLDGLLLPNRVDRRPFDSYGYDVMADDNFDIDRADIWEAYSECLQLALESVSEFVDATSGRVVVTADHGELFHERIGSLGPRLSGHPQNLKTDVLREVPWLVIDDGNRPNVRADPPIEPADVDDEAIDKRLQYLGYK